MAYKKERPFTLDAFLKGKGASVYSHTCPNCRQKIHLQAIVDKFGEPSSWMFYGKQGQRKVRCQGAIFDGTWFTHFYVINANGTFSHRLAWEKMTDE